MTRDCTCSLCVTAQTSLSLLARSRKLCVVIKQLIATDWLCIRQLTCYANLSNAHDALNMHACWLSTCLKLLSYTKYVPTPIDVHFLRYTQLQDARGKRIRAASLDNKPSLKRLQAKLEEKAQVESALAAASAAALGQTDAAATSNDTVIEDEDVRIERELAQMKADRLKAIQALPRSVWS